MKSIFAQPNTNRGFRPPLSENEYYLWRAGLCFWVFSTLTFMAGMSVGGAVMMLSGIFFSWRANAARAWAAAPQRILAIASLAFLATSALSLVAARIWPPLGIPAEDFKSLLKFHYFFYPFVVSWALLETSPRKYRIEDHPIWAVLYWMGLFVSIVSLLQFFGRFLFPPDWLSARFFRPLAWSPYFHAQGLMMFHLSFATAMCFVVSYSVARWLWEKSFRWGLLAFLSSIAVVLTFSRIALIALPAIWICLGFLRSKKIALITLVFFISVGAIAWTTSSALRTRFVDNYGGFGGRTSVWASSLEMFLERPLVGVGLGKTAQYSSLYFEKIHGQKPEFSSHAHNNFLEVLAGTGLLGLASLTFWWALLIGFAVRGFSRSAGRSEQWLPAALIASAIAFHINGLTQVNFMDAKSQHSLMLWAGLCLALSLRGAESNGPDLGGTHRI